MQHSEKLLDEAGRIAALRRYSVLDTAPEQPFDKLTDLVRNVFEVPFAAVSLIDAERQWFKSIVGLAQSQTPRDSSFCAHTIKTYEPMIIPDATLDIRFSNNPLVTGDPWIRSYMGVPLQTPDGYNLGALCAIDTKPRTFDRSQIEIMKSFAALVLNELELRQIATSDTLTGALSRRGWVAMAEKEMARCRRHGAKAAIIMFDIDHFKSVNDSYGHSTGDAVLRTVTQRCLSELRQEDTLGRIGGEEFSVLLPDSGQHEAMIIAERLRRSFSDTPVVVNGTPLRISASFGVQSLSDGVSSVDSWLADADAHLYAAKAAGRDCCRGG